MYRIMIIEDNEKIRNELCDFLGKNGYEALGPDDFEHTLDIIHKEQPDLLLLDLNLPVVDGHFICREVRKSSDMPIIIVTSRDSDMDELISMNLGADDFVTKPYNLQILLARIARVLQRTYEHASSNILTIHDIALDISKSTLTWKGNSIDLTKNELRIMHCLFQNKNKIVSRNELMQHMWDCDLFVDNNTLTVNINRLRKKLEYLRLDDLIQTKRGMDTSYMRTNEFIREKLYLIMISFLTSIITILFLYAIQVNGQVILIISLLQWGMVLACLIIEYLRRSTYYHRLEQTLDGLDQKYLLTEISRCLWTAKFYMKPCALWINPWQIM